VSAAAFAAAMVPLGPFERSPALAVGWSGGGDSTALLALADEWARARGGRVVALHVDHGLRAGSADEAALLAARAAAWNVEFAGLRWDGAKPATGIMAAARDARMGLLEAACEARGIWHLLLAHQHEDRCETVALRAARGSGADGLAGISAIVERARVRVLRPLLACAHADLLATCRARARDWLDDPSNRDPRFARAALRLAGGAPDVDFAAAAGARAGRERALARLLAHAAALDPAGFALVDPAALRAAPPDLAVAALARIARTVGGGDYAPRGPRLAAALPGVLAGRPRTLGSCRFVPRRDGSVLVAREAAGLQPPLAVPPGGRVLWDGRFEAAAGPSAAGWRIGALGEDGWARLPRDLRAAAAKRIPPAARPVLPALHGLDGGVAVPHLFYGREQGPQATVDVRFRPRHPLAGPPFADASPAAGDA
jgi:tRNA(Ile)-lysidine synthase